MRKFSSVCYSYKVTKKEIEGLFEKQAKSFDYKLEAVLEYARQIPGIRGDITEIKEDISGIKEKVDIIFDQVGHLTVDVEILKEDKRREGQRIGKP